MSLRDATSQVPSAEPHSPAGEGELGAVPSPHPAHLLSLGVTALAPAFSQPLRCHCSIRVSLRALALPRAQAVTGGAT